jgi:hypothetical protein
MPANIKDHILHRLNDHDAITLRKRRMLDERKLDERILRALGPVAVKLLRHLHHFGWIHVACQH